MTKTELESKHLADLHALAAEAGVPRYRMLSRAELIARLAGESVDSTDPGSSAAATSGREESGQPSTSSRPRRRRRRRPSQAGEGGSGADGDEEPRRASRSGGDAGRSERRPEQASERQPSGPAAPSSPETSSTSGAAAEAGRPRRRRRRRFGRRKDRGVTLPDLLLPPRAGRQTVLCAESREACTALLRGVAADLSTAGKGPDPIALLIDPGPEELADWKREAPRVEIVAAGQARHADDALAAAVSRAGAGEDVILLIDSLNRLGEAHGDSEAAREFLDSGNLQDATTGGSLTVVAALVAP